MTDKNTLKIVCEELVCIPSGAGVMQHIIFNPNEETLDTINDKYNADDNEYYTISVTDNGGDHVSSRMHRMVRFRKERNVVILTTVEG